MGIVQLVVPLVLADLPVRLAEAATNVEVRHALVASPYLGGTVLVFVLAAGYARPRRMAALMAAAFVFYVIYALGHHTPAHAVLARLIPPLGKLRYTAKATAPLALAWSVLAGLGFDALVGSSRRTRLLCALPLLVLLLGDLAAYAAATRFAERAGPGLGVVLEAPGAAYAGAFAPLAGRLLLTIGVTAAAFVGLLAPRFEGALSAIVALLAVVDLTHAAAPLNPTASRADLDRMPEVVRALPPGPHRIHSWDYRRTVDRPGNAERAAPSDFPAAAAASGNRALGLFRETQERVRPYVGARFGLRGSFDEEVTGLLPREVSNLLLLFIATQGPSTLRLLQMTGVDHVFAIHERGLEFLEPVAAFPIPRVTGYQYRVYRVPDPLPWAYVVGGARVATGAAQYTTLVDPGFDPRREVLLDAGAAARVGAAGDCRLLDARPDRAVIEARMDTAGFVVVLDGYDPGWRVTVDGAEAPALRANVVFRAVRVEAGQHRIVWSYRPRAIVVGLALSASAFLVGAGALVLDARARRACPPPRMPDTGRENAT